MTQITMSLSETTSALAQSFISALDISGVDAPAGMLLLPQSLAVTQPSTSDTIADRADIRLTEGMNQAFLVGSQVVSFDDSVTEARRSASLNSCLLAQLRANMLHPSPGTATEAFEWHAAYVNTLVNIGWVLQSGVSAQQSTAANGAFVNKVIFDIVSTLLGGGAALQLASKVLASLQELDKSDPFFTLYSSRVVEQNMIEFGASLGTSQSNGFLLSVVECAVELKTKHTEALFFKWDASSASIDARRYDLSLADDVYTAIASQVRDKVAPYTASYISSLGI